MIRIAIVEDSENERVKIKECLSDFERGSDVSFDVQEFPNGLAFLEAYTPEYDLVFMDIEMPGLNGMETAKELRKTDPSVILIFITNLAQYAISGYEVDALDFILKPINRYSFSIKLKRALSRVTTKIEDYMSVKTDGEMRAVRISSVLWIDVSGHYVVYHTAVGDFTEYTTLKEAAAKVNHGAFALVNRSCLVNLRRIEAITRDTVSVGSVKLDISRPQRKAFLAALSDYMGGSL